MKFSKKRIMALFMAMLMVFGTFSTALASAVMDEVFEIENAASFTLIFDGQDVQRGGILPLSYSANGDAYTVGWELAGNESVNTAIADDILYVAADEAARELTVFGVLYSVTLNDEADAEDDAEYEESLDEDVLGVIYTPVSFAMATVFVVDPFDVGGSFNGGGVVIYDLALDTLDGLTNETVAEHELFRAPAGASVLAGSDTPKQLSLTGRTGNSQGIDMDVEKLVELFSAEAADGYTYNFEIAGTVGATAMSSGSSTYLRVVRPSSTTPELPTVTFFSTGTLGEGGSFDFEFTVKHDDVVSHATDGGTQLYRIGTNSSATNDQSIRVTKLIITEIPPASSGSDDDDCPVHTPVWELEYDKLAALEGVEGNRNTLIGTNYNSGVQKSSSAGSTISFVPGNNYFTWLTLTAYREIEILRTADDAFVGEAGKEYRVEFDARSSSIIRIRGNQTEANGETEISNLEFDVWKPVSATWEQIGSDTFRISMADPAILDVRNLKIFEVADPADCTCATGCPVHDAEPVWAPNLVGATAATGVGRNYISDANGNPLGLIASSSITAAGKGIEILPGGIISYTSAGNNQRLTVIAVGTGTNPSAEPGYAFEPVDGTDYRITLNATLADGTTPATIRFRETEAVKQEADAVPVEGTLFSYNFNYTLDNRVHANDGDGGHGKQVVGIDTRGSDGSVVFFSNIKIFEAVDPSLCTCEDENANHVPFTWGVAGGLPLHNATDETAYKGGSVSFVHGDAASGNDEPAVLRLNGVVITDGDKDAIRNADISTLYVYPGNSGNRRIWVWTDLSGQRAGATGDPATLGFLTDANTAAGAILSMGGNTGTGSASDPFEIRIPKNLLYIPAAGSEPEKFAQQLYIMTSVGTSGGNETLSAMVPPATGNLRRDVTTAINYVTIELKDAPPFATNISLNYGVDETEMSFTWWTPKGVAEESTVQLVKFSDLVGGEMPNDASTFYSGEDKPTAIPSELAMYAFDVNRVTIEGLQSGEKYAYRVGDKGDPDSWSKIYSFEVLAGEKYTVIAVADPQISSSSGSMPARWRNSMTRAVARVTSEGNVASFMLSAGDNAAYANDPAEYTTYLSPEELRYLPVFTTVGNHDTVDQRAATLGYEMHLGLLSLIYTWPNHDWAGGGVTSTDIQRRGGGHHYFSYGDVLYISLNTNIAGGSDQSVYVDFLEKAVASHPDATWRIATFHHDIFGSGNGHAQNMPAGRQNLGPILKEFGIDFVINGHDHTHGRSLFMDGRTPVMDQRPADFAGNLDEKLVYQGNPGVFVAPEGIVYMTLGSPADFPKYSSAIPMYPWVAYTDPPENDSRAQYSVMTIDGDSLTLRSFAVPYSGGVPTMGAEEIMHDSITIRKTARFEDLTQLITGTAALDKGDISDATWTEFQAAITAGSALTASSPSADIHGAYMTIYDKYYALVPETDKTALAALIETVTEAHANATEGLWAGQYQIGSRAVLKLALDAAVTVNDLKLSTQAEIDEQFALLSAAYAHFLTLVSDADRPWIDVHDIPATGTYELGLLHWMEDSKRLIQHITDSVSDMTPRYFAHFTKKNFAGGSLLGTSYSVLTPHEFTVPRTETLFGPVNAMGGRGNPAAHITKTHLAEWIRYELNVAEAGEYLVQLGAMNKQTAAMEVRLRDLDKNTLATFIVPAGHGVAEGWDAAPMISASNNIYLPEGEFILEMLFMNDGSTRATHSSSGNPSVYPDGVDVDILTLQRVGDAEPTEFVIPGNWFIMPDPNQFAGVPRRQRGWATPGASSSEHGPVIETEFKLNQVSSATHIVLEVAGRPAGNVEIVLAGGISGSWNQLEGSNYPIAEMYDPITNTVTIDLSRNPAFNNWRNVADEAPRTLILNHNSDTWDEINLVRAYLLLDNGYVPPVDPDPDDNICPDCGKPITGSGGELTLSNAIGERNQLTANLKSEDGGSWFSGQISLPLSSAIVAAGVGTTPEQVLTGIGAHTIEVTAQITAVHGGTGAFANIGVEDFSFQVYREWDSDPYYADGGSQSFVALNTPVTATLDVTGLTGAFYSRGIGVQFAIDENTPGADGSTATISVEILDAKVIGTGGNEDLCTCDGDDKPDPVCPDCGKNPCECEDIIIISEKIWELDIKPSLVDFLMDNGDDGVFEGVQSADNPAFAIVNGALEISSRTNHWFGLDVRIDEPHLSLEDGVNYRIVVHGSGVSNQLALHFPLDSAPWNTTDIIGSNNKVEMEFTTATIPPTNLAEPRIRIKTTGTDTFTITSAYIEKLTSVVVPPTPDVCDVCKQDPCVCDDNDNPYVPPYVPPYFPPSDIINSGNNNPRNNVTPSTTEPADTGDKDETTDAPGGTVGLTINKTVTVDEATLLAHLENGEDLVLVIDGVVVTIPNSVLVALLDADNLVGFAVEVVVTPHGFGGESDSAIYTVSVKILLDGTVVTQLPSPIKVSVPLEDIDLSGLNTFCIVAVLANGTIIGGKYNTANGMFELETSVSGEFVITYIPNLKRLSIQVGGSTITDLCGNAATQVMDVPPMIIDGRTLLPLRYMANALGAEIAWDDATKTVTLTLNGTSLSFVIGEMAPGMDIPAALIDDRTMVPLRFVSEFFGALVVWNEETKTIEIISL